MGRPRSRIRAAAAAAFVVAAGMAVALPGAAQPAPTLTLVPNAGDSGSVTSVDGTGFRGVGAVTITEGGRFAGTTTAEPSGKLTPVDITITGFGAVIVRGCQDDGLGDPCGYTATATFTAPTTTTTTTVPTTTTTMVPTTTTTTTVPTTTTTSTTTTTLPGTTTTTDATTTTTVPGTTSTTTGTSTTSTTAPGTTTTVTAATTTTAAPPGLGAPEGSESVAPETSGDGAESGGDPETGPDEDTPGIAAARIARNTDEVALWPFMLSGAAVWLVAIGIWLLARRRASLRR